MLNDLTFNQHRHLPAYAFNTTTLHSNIKKKKQIYDTNITLNFLIINEILISKIKNTLLYQ
jgi:hypothetical protein